ncbi:MAG: putative motility protein [Clostridiales bacterium]|jgi:hypothetical protein|uniref:YjfB family protein n=1 Tax=Bovifimicola ammoniilytica TaxID=2981720 RepID=UPI0003412335|nr:YjfB family protein [Bovifimicola ammoniilytica]MBD8943156.1 putative motility protein [Clostridiales bacterium]CCZ03913.1 putative uncharacterized protein [Eubacterium sp. CAG:603]SCJ72731.1 Uncharacterised protein [uncultured Eubacterium sp.]MCI5604025.1 YjfB family protein [Clostridiales bacterium]MCU6753781.1 YjfB family protein [Bovifimicola ammoniilytica]
MDIQGLSLASITLSSANVNTDIGMALLSKSLEATDETGAAMIEMLEKSVNPMVGQNIDIRI